MTRLRQATAWQARKKTGNKIIEPFRFFRVFRGQKRFIYPRNTLKDAKISKTKDGWIVFRRHDQAFAVADAQTRRPRDRRSLFDPWNIRAIRVIRGDPYGFNPSTSNEELR